MGAQIVQFGGRKIKNKGNAVSASYTISLKVCYNNKEILRTFA
jgi:hypothetical protein